MFSPNRLSFVLLISGCILLKSMSSCFALLSPISATTLKRHTNAATTLSMFIVEEEEKEEEQKPTTIEVTDKNGTPLAVGDIVSVTQELQAFQVPPKARGRYLDKIFVPLSEAEDVGRSARHLLIPVGMRGKISKLIVESNLSANFRVRVDFAPGEDHGSGFDPPVAFVMHFGSNEIEKV